MKLHTVLAVAALAAFAAAPSWALTNIIKAQSNCVAKVTALPEVGAKASVVVDQSKITADGDNFFMAVAVKTPDGKSTVYSCTASRKSSDTTVTLPTAP